MIPARPAEPWLEFSFFGFDIPPDRRDETVLWFLRIEFL